MAEEETGPKCVTSVNVSLAVEDIPATTTPTISIESVMNMGSESVDSESHNESPPSILPGCAQLIGNLNIADGDTQSNSSAVNTSDDESPSNSKKKQTNSKEQDEEKEFIPPSDELKEKILRQVDFYFSDANILKDSFLLKHVRRNKLGYVSLKLITSFKRMKSLTKDYRVVAFSLKDSEKLEVNVEGTKIRRKDPLPEHDETIPSRSVVVVNFSAENPSIESVAEMFNKYGEVSLIRILRPGKPVPPDVKRHANKHPEIGNTVCAVVEFEKHESARVACEKLNDSLDWRRGMRVVLLATPKKKEKSSGAKENELVGKIETDANNSNASNSKNVSAIEKRKKKGQNVKNAQVDKLGVDDSACSSGSDAEQARSRSNSLKVQQGSNHSSPRSSPLNSPRSPRRRKDIGKSPLVDGVSPRSSPEMSRRTIDGNGTNSGSSSPWVQRRMRAAQEQSRTSPMASPLLSRRRMEIEGVLRQPRGPDGTRGFHSPRGSGSTIEGTVSLTT